MLGRSPPFGLSAAIARGLLASIPFPASLFDLSVVAGKSRDRRKSLKPIYIKWVQILVPKFPYYKVWAA